MTRKRKSDYDELRQLKEKIRKLERGRSRHRRRRVLSSTSSESPASPLHSRSQSRTSHPSPECSQDIHAATADVESIITQAQVHTPPTTNCRKVRPHNQCPAQLSTEPIEIADPNDTTNEIIMETPIVEPELSSDILEILGDDPSSLKKFGNDIQKELATRFNHIATNGLSKELRKEIQGKYPIPANCTLIDAPQLNPEVKAAISGSISKRLAAMEQKQKQLASAISCLGEAITLLISQKDTDPKLLRLLMDAGRMVCDTQFNDSLTRRYFALASLNKEMKDQLLLTKIDSFLFGKNLSETLKSAKAKNKSGADLKQPQTRKQFQWKSNNKNSADKKNNLNEKTPSSRRSTGSSRPQLPAPKNQPVSSSKSSRTTYKRIRR